MASTLTRTIKLGFSLAGIAVSAAGFILNVIGAYSLVSIRARGNKQTNLLINISVISVCLCVLFIPSWTLWGIVVHSNNEKVEKILFILQTGFYMAYVTSTFGLTIDRFLAVAKPFKYRSIVTNRFIIRWIYGCWALAQLTRIPCMSIKSCKLIYLVYFDVSINAVNVTFQPATYIYILIKLKHRRSQLQNKVAKNSPANIKTIVTHARNANREAGMLQIALVITACCLVSSICDIIYVALGISTPSSKDTIMSPIALMLWNIVAAVQSLLYIVTKPEIRKFVMKKFCCIET